MRLRTLGQLTLGQWPFGQWTLGQWTLGQWALGQLTFGQWTLGLCFMIALGLPSLSTAQMQPPGDRELPPLSGFAIIPFNFGPPGARALGMGGAFIALADDATAAEANPAGLTKLSRPEFSVHGRYSNLDLTTLDLNALTSLDALNRFRTFEPPLRPRDRIGNAFATDTQLLFDPSVSEASFVSYVKPAKGYTFSFFYQRSVDASDINTFRAFDDSLLDLYQTRQEIDVRLDTLGISAAFEAGDFLSVGFSVRLSQLALASLLDSRVDYQADMEFAQLAPGASLEEVEALGIVDQQVLRELFDDEDLDVTFNVGILLNPRGKFSVGLVYKDGGQFDVEGFSEDFGCREPNPPPGFICRPANQMRTNQRLKAPDFLGLGFAWRITDRLRLALDANAITYSDLSIAPAPNPNAGPSLASQFEPIDDVVEMHLGLEYVTFLGANRAPLTLRIGAYTDPDHDGIRNIDSDDTVYTVGLGTVFMESFQLDLAAQKSDRNEAGILSMVYRF